MLWRAGFLRSREASAGRVGMAGIVATSVTHPIAWHAMAWLRPMVEDWWARASLVELGVVGVEAGVFVVLLRLSVLRGAAVSAIANAVSFGLGLIWVSAASGGPSCPAGFVEDPARTAAIEALVGHRVHLAMCFGEVRERGQRDPEGRLRLDADTPLPLLAARVAHLEHHVAPDGHGPSCVDRLLREEAVGWTTELLVRERLGVSDPSCPVEAAMGEGPSLRAVERWLSTSSDPLAEARRHSHRRRCGQ
ncbi:MAG: hypothetical protein KTR31_42025 [Myxococcales bacterium]|nr:hypothetical protein [Myxococcales bacterium]